MTPSSEKPADSGHHELAQRVRHATGLHDLADSGSVKRAWLPRRNMAGCMAETTARPRARARGAPHRRKPARSLRCSSTSPLTRDRRSLPPRAALAGDRGRRSARPGAQASSGLRAACLRRSPTAVTRRRPRQPDRMPSGPTAEVEHREGRADPLRRPERRAPRAAAAGLRRDRRRVTTVVAAAHCRRIGIRSGTSGIRPPVPARLADVAARPGPHSHDPQMGKMAVDTA